MPPCLRKEGAVARLLLLAVLFVKLEESANMTKRSWRGKVFSVKELAQ